MYLLYTICLDCSPKYNRTRITLLISELPPSLMAVLFVIGFFYGIKQKTLDIRVDFCYINNVFKILSFVHHVLRDDRTKVSHL